MMSTLLTGVVFVLGLVLGLVFGVVLGVVLVLRGGSVCVIEKTPDGRRFIKSKAEVIWLQEDLGKRRK